MSITTHEKKTDRKRIAAIRKNEKPFSAHGHVGRGRKAFEVIEGKSVIAITAPHAVSYFEGGSRSADAYSGGLAKALATDTGCFAFLPRKGYDGDRRAELANEMAQFFRQRRLKIAVDLQLVETAADTVVFLDKDDPDDPKYGFLSRAIQYSFEYRYQDSGIDRIAGEGAARPSSITYEAASSAGMKYVYLGINKRYVSPDDKERLAFLYDTLLETLRMLSNLDWDAEMIRVYRLWQSAMHKPQDKIEIVSTERTGAFEKESLLNICTYGLELEKVRLHEPQRKTLEELEQGASGSFAKAEYVFLTNRLIEILFGREWIEADEARPGLQGAPILVYASRREVYPIGLPKANQIDGVTFSSGLYEEKREESKLFDYVLFNRYSDSRLYIDYEKADYGDHGRVRTADGQPAKRVMIPRYYKRLLGYLDYPLLMIRKEEYERILPQLSEAEKAAFDGCYEKIKGEVFYKIRDRFADRQVDGPETDGDTETEGIKKTVVDAQTRLGLYRNIEILRVPKEVKPREKLFKRIKKRFEKLTDTILKKAIGKSEYLLKTEWTSETDDRNNIARLSSNMMSLLGVSENDKILVRFGKKQEILRVLAKDELTDYQIGIPAPARKRLGMNSINDIVIVQRDMVHIFLRHSEEQTIAMLGTVLAVFQVIQRIWVGALLCMLLTPLIMYFVLNEERVKVK